MNEAILFIVFAAVIFGGYFLLRKIPKPTVNYVRLIMAALLLGLVWLDWGVDNKNWGPQIILTLLAVSSMIREFINLKKFYSKHNQATKKLNIEN